MEILTHLLQEVHSKPSFEKYESTRVRNNTNCYSHALGMTFPNIELYRIGAISNKKPVDQEYFSIEEINYFPWSIVGIYKISRKGTF